MSDHWRAWFFWFSSYCKNCKPLASLAGVLIYQKTKENLGSIECIKGDICDFESIKACANIDVLYHNVAQVPLAKDIPAFNRVNIDGTKHALRAAMNAE